MIWVAPISNQIIIHQSSLINVQSTIAWYTAFGNSMRSVRIGV